MKKLIKLIANLQLSPKTNNLLHLIVGVLVGASIHFLLELTGKLPEEWYYSFFFKGLITWTVMKVAGERWEEYQMKISKAQHSKLDVALGITGGILAVTILTIL